MEKHQETPEPEVESGIQEEILDEIADLEEYAKLGKRPPRCRGYRIRINGERFEVHEPTIKGSQVLRLAGKEPPQDYTVWLKLRGERPEKIGLDEEVNLRRPGVEKFKTLPRDQSEG
jgi:multiubiquitin